MRTRLVPLLVPLLFRLPPVRRFMFRTLSQIGVNYRHSPLSAGAAGAVHGGDRLPWVERSRDKIISPRSPRWRGRSTSTENRDAAWPRPALNLGYRSMCSHGSRKCVAPACSAALYLVRPDGYVALADPNAEPERLRHYFDERGGVGRHGG